MYKNDLAKFILILTVDIMLINIIDSDDKSCNCNGYWQNSGE